MPELLFIGALQSRKRCVVRDILPHGGVAFLLAGGVVRGMGSRIGRDKGLARDGVQDKQDKRHRAGILVLGNPIVKRYERCVGAGGHVGLVE